MHIVIYEIK